MSLRIAIKLCKLYQTLLVDWNQADEEVNFSKSNDCSVCFMQICIFLISRLGIKVDAEKAEEAAVRPQSSIYITFKLNSVFKEIGA